jgi:RNA-binding protein YhbY
MSKGTLLKEASIKQLEHEINKRRVVKVKELEAQKQEIENKIKKLANNSGDAVIETINDGKSKMLKKSMSKTVVTGTSEESLKDRLIRLGGDRGVRTTNEFLTMLEVEGWKSTSPKPYYVVAAALASLEKKNVFRRISKGSYQLVGAQ